MKNILLVLLLVFNQTIWAECPESVSLIKKGEPAVCDGVLLSPDASKKADEAIQDSKYYKLLSERLYKRQEVQIKEVEILDKRLQLYIDQSNVLAKEVVRKDSEDKWQRIIYFGLGVLATGIAVYGAAQLR